MSDKEIGQTHVEAAKPGFGARLKAHYKKFWWLHLGIFIAVFLVILLPIVFVYYPKLAQEQINDSVLEITGMKITNPTPEGFDLEVHQIIHTTSKYHPVLDSFDADLSLAETLDKPFFSLTVPSIKAHDGVKVDIKQNIKLQDLDAFTAYSIATLKEESLDVAITGETGLREGALPKTTVQYDKTINMKGLNALKGFNVTEFKLVGGEDDGTNMIGNVFIPNPSVLSLNMGDVTLSLSVDGKDVGESHLKNLSIKPGDNNIEMRSKIEQAKVLGFIAGKNAKYKSGVLPITVVGKTSMANGKELTYFSKALASNTLKLDLNLGPLLGL
ncbi:hypothetical protein FQN50_005391 [Emmonsiellopsis sp. PD_5]|nr:hypothetical protein FQN50_005391 [Emmonsiellopsis sp. PD_5]